LLNQCWRNQAGSDAFDSWLEKDQRMLIHAGGKSRRLPAYAPTGKILTPIPVFRWKKGQPVDQKLLDIQLPFYEKMLSKTPASLNTLIASGDILILNEEDLGPLPDVDVLMLGTWTDASQASQHGVFFSPRHNSGVLDFILQKPTIQEIQKWTPSHFFMMDMGVWLLSSKAIRLLMEACNWDAGKERFAHSENIPGFYDLYGEFSHFLGHSPTKHHPEYNSLSTAIVPLQAGSFFHYGTSRELIDSTYRIQNKVTDQREIWHNRVKPHPNIFVMNTVHEGKLVQGHQNLWMENAYIPASWNFYHSHIFTGIPENQWNLEVPAGICLDMIPVGKDQWCIRPYGMDDVMRGPANHPSTAWLNEPLVRWFEKRQMNFSDAGMDKEADIHDLPLFPLVRPEDGIGDFVQWMISDPEGNHSFKDKWVHSKRLSSSQLQDEINLERLYEQRKNFLCRALPKMAKNYNQSVFYQVDLDHLSGIYKDYDLPLPEKTGREASLINHIHNRMFLARTTQKRQDDQKDYEKDYEKEAFDLLQEGIIESGHIKDERPSRNVLNDQIVWARSPVRLDLAGGWSDTPPYCIVNGGSVMNLAVELNGQPPLQVYVTPSDDFCIRIKSIDLSLELVISDYRDMEDYNQVGSGFAIAKVALLLSGFHPRYGASHHALRDQLKDFGGGFDISLLAAVPKGSGLGTSSILAATLLGALSEFCGLNTSHTAIGQKTLVLEQMLTTGGGWQDQYGGILSGAKLIETQPGFEQSPEVRWLPEHLFQNEDTRSCMMLYYTGVTRVAKNILGEIVRGMFLNRQETLSCLDEIKAHAGGLAESIRKSDWDAFNRGIEQSWHLNQRLDEGTNPPSIQRILQPIDPLLLSKKLLGAGGGGYLFMIAKDPDDTAKVKNYLSHNPPNPKARFVDFRLSGEGLTITKS